MKRIIALILVLATAFLTLTGCAFRYDKHKMSKYADFDAEAFRNALQELTVSLGSFSNDPAKRDTLTMDEVAKALLTATGTTNKRTFDRTNDPAVIGVYDSVYFGYYATDSKGNIFYANKLDEAKLTNIQLGLSTLTGLNAEIAEALKGKNIEEYLYSTTSGNYVKAGDVVAVSYEIIWTDSTGKSNIEFVNNHYLELSTLEAAPQRELCEALIGKAQVGIALENQVTFTEAGETKSYNNVKVESIVKPATERSDKVASGNAAYVSYTLTFPVSSLTLTGDGAYDFPAEIKDMNPTVKGDQVQITVSYEKVIAGAENNNFAAKHLATQLAGKTVGGDKFNADVTGVALSNGNTTDLKYSNVTVHWVQKTSNPAITFEYKPFEEEYDAEKKNEKTEKNIYGEAIRLNGETLTYHVFPVYYIDVVNGLFTENADAEDIATLILTECYKTAITNMTDAFSKITSEEYKGAENKTAKDLLGELYTLLGTLSTKTSNASSALTELTKAQENRAKNTNTDNVESLKDKESKAYDSYQTAKNEERAARDSVTIKVGEILACKKGETGIAADVIADYKQYHYDTLDATFRSDIKKALASAISTVLKSESTVTFNKLPKKAVNQAYKALMDAYQQDFYEGKYTTTGSSTSSSVSQTNYEKYEGNFNRYLIAKVLNGKEGTVKDAKAAVRVMAEDAVKEIMYVYILTEMVEEAWDTELSLTKQEKKDFADYLEYYAYQMSLYGQTFTYNLEDAYNGAQFDKTMEFLLTSEETTDAESGIEYDKYTHITYTGK